MSIDGKLFESVCARAREAMMLQSAADALEWDERTGMPIAAGEYRAGQVSTLRAMVHRIRTDSAYGDDLQRLADDASVRIRMATWARRYEGCTEIGIATASCRRSWLRRQPRQRYAVSRLGTPRGRRMTMGCFVTP